MNPPGCSAKRAEVSPSVATCRYLGVTKCSCQRSTSVQRARRDRLRRRLGRQRSTRWCSDGSDGTRTGGAARSAAPQSNELLHALRVGEVCAERGRIAACVPAAERVLGEVEVPDHLQDAAQTGKDEVQGDPVQVVDEGAVAELEDLACGLAHPRQALAVGRDS